MEQRARDLLSIGDALFSSRFDLLSLWQEVAENFYPERADFIAGRSPGEEFASGLMSSYPVVARRELGNLFGSILRPRQTDWFALHAADEAVDDARGPRAWLEYASGVQRRAMYDPVTQFVRATKEGDHDFAAFGQAVLQVETTTTRDALLYRCFHLRDNAWSENQNGRIDTNHRKWLPTARQLGMLFPKTIHRTIAEALKTEPERRFACRHVVVPEADYQLTGRKTRKQFAFVSLYIDVENEIVLEQVPLAWFPYVIPRWQTVSGSQYARSPATEIALPDARLLQAMVRVILEAGEKAVDPPMVATEEVVRSDIAIYAGGVTWVDKEYDERLGEPLRPIARDKTGLPFGLDLAAGIRSAITEGMFLNKLNLPDLNQKTMTAFEIRKRIEEHVRASAPIFEPIEEEYNAALCNLTFDILRANGAFGDPANIPPELRGSEVQFRFESPLAEVTDGMKAQQFAEGLTLVGQAAQIDPAQIENVDLTEATRDSLRGMRWPATWMKDEKAVKEKRSQVAAQQKAAMGTQALGAGAEIADKAGGAMAKMKQGGIDPAALLGAQPEAA